jgi:hypothetical protein
MATPIEPGSPATEENQFLLKNLGVFAVLWSKFDVLVDTANMKLLNLTPMQAAIVGPNLGFKAKLSILQSLLSLEPDKNKQTLSALADVTAIAGRNAIMHGHIDIGENWIEFVKIEVGPKISARQRRFEDDEFHDHLLALDAAMTKTQQLLGLSDSDLDIIEKIGKSLSSKPPTSPSAPSAKKP